MLQGLLLFTQLFIVSAGAMDCLDGIGAKLSIDNAQVLRWKTTTVNQFQARGYIVGTVMDIYPNHTGHAHFAIDLDPAPGAHVKDAIEVIYNMNFGPLPPVRVGMKVEACGDYITSNAPAGSYPASPTGAIIHWVHKNPRPEGHPSGFLVINGTLYGQDVRPPQRAIEFSQ